MVWVYIGSDNGLLPDGTKPLPEPELAYYYYHYYYKVLWYLLEQARSQATSLYNEFDH